MREYWKQMDSRMFDFQDFYNQVANYLPDNSVLAEVGVADGTSSIFLAEALLNKGKSFKLWMIDSLAYGGPDQLQSIVRHVCKAGVSDHVEILTVDSLNASCRFPDGHFDFVFVDASHRFEFTKADIRCWYEKIKENATLAGHDYNGFDGQEVKNAVDLVIPKMVIRSPIPGQAFDPETVLKTDTTSSGCGVWWLQKKFYLRLN